MHPFSGILGSFLLVFAAGVSPVSAPWVSPAPAEPLALQVQGTGAQFTRDELRVIGKAMMDSLIRQYGLTSDTTRNREVRDIINTLSRGAGHQEQITYGILNKKNDVNAFALPGGYIVIYDGTLDVYRQEARRIARGDAAAEARTYQGFVAALLAHELAHHTLGHTRRYLRGGRPTLDTLVARRESRARELAADQAGALYLLWSGWEIQDAMDEHRIYDAIERSSPRFYGIESATYNRTHPRSAYREAEVEAFRAEIKRNQTRFDDALTLIAANPPGGQEMAIALLDTVLTYLPYLTEAYHARATAFHQKYLNLVSPQALLVQMPLMTYPSYFLPGIRGGSDPALLDNARRDYERAMTLELKPLTLSQLALIDLLQGRVAKAEQGARRAVALAPTSGIVLNSLGAVFYHVRKYDSARVAFERARLQAGWEDYPPFLFNLGRTLVQQGDPAGRAMLERYATLDQRSYWHREALTLLGGQPAGGPPPGSARTSPPAIAGVMLGSSPDQVISQLGTPELRTPGTDGEYWRYDRKGLALFFSADRRLVLVALFTRDAGTVEGIRVGDPTATVSQRWGTATVTPKGEWFYSRGSWSVLLRSDKDVIVMLALVTT